MYYREPVPQRLLPALALLGVLSLVAGCGASTECVDRDFDGYGRHCAMGEDCDDENAARNVDCDAVPPPDCDAEPEATGCPCPGAVGRDCYGGAEGTADIGRCASGERICRNLRWGLCEGEVLPRSERCDGIDDDCDGRTDEGTRSPCGGCDSSCVGAVWGDDGLPFVAGGELVLVGPGNLTLSRGELPLTDLWVANTLENTVSRVDTVAGAEVARHATGGAEPTRVAVDHLGDVFVLNRAPGGVGSLVKIAGDESRCIDRDGTPGIRTSTGPGDTPSVEEDECVLFVVSLGEAGELPRALAVDGDTTRSAGGDVWVGMHDGERVLRVSGADGSVLESVATPDFHPHAATFTPDGILHLLDRDGLLRHLDRRAEPPALTSTTMPNACFVLFGLAPLDTEDLMLTGFFCDTVSRLDVDARAFTTRSVDPSTRGIVGRGTRYLVAHTEGRASVLSATNLGVEQSVALDAEGIQPVDTVGAAIDAEGHGWLISAASNLGRGVATEVDLDEGVVRRQVPLGIGSLSLGDATGGMRPGGFAPMGQTSERFDGCGSDETEWVAVHLAARYGVAGHIDVEARHAAREDALDGATFELVGTRSSDDGPLPLDFPSGGAVELRITLRTDASDGAPVLERVGLEWRCRSVVPG